VSSSPHPLAGDRIGPYVLEEQIGQGAMGVVFRGRRDGDDHPVAVKVLRPELSADETYRHRFQREVKIASQVEHPHLVRILESGRADGLEFIVVELGQHGTLDDLLERGGPLPVSEVVLYAGQLAGAIDALHRNDLIHRDIKPSNALLTDGRDVRLTDFGLASGRAFTVLTRPGQVLGTIDYLAPELITGKRAAPSSDIYAFSCVLYELLTGRPPFASKNILEAASAHLEQEPVHPAVIRPELSRSVGDVVGFGLAKEPEQRPETATAIARMLEVAVRA